MITINGTSVSFDEPMTVGTYLDAHQYRRSLIAVELNYEILPKSRYDETILKDGDILEVVSFVGGG
ncbi:MAG: sulfur carrier protein ThiS [Lachnospiraceae bacterium]|nr:sulfur carrier protein ThiS [Lachnospiraceae bacterium]